MTFAMDTNWTAELLADFERDGYGIVRGLLAREEALALSAHFMDLHASGAVEGYFNPLSPAEAGGDLLRVFPRMVLPHRFDPTSRTYLLDRRVESILRRLFGEEPLAAQSMFYFKPPGARGQALHQDDFYLRTSPGRCIAAWLSLDDAGRANGGLTVVPGTQRLPLLCPHAADLRNSFAIEEVDAPPGLEPVPVDLMMGDCLFFNGSVIHGSGPNTSQDRFRRSFICHYVPRSTQAMAGWYSSLMTFEGLDVTCQANGEGGPCGTEQLEALRQGLMEQGELVRAGVEQGAFALP